ncbi:hypothetical protein UY3_13262 [Chelonia mydas]|uniref:Uncharacterized protein n=1 Tax=Chelonia mydas TaxID=8469 RepID=M7AXX1_CHEMY|nr:hypothetical protein UY3_13262 [Chelonia mydas]
MVIFLSCPIGFNGSVPDILIEVPHGTSKGAVSGPTECTTTLIFLLRKHNLTWHSSHCYAKEGFCIVIIVGEIRTNDESKDIAFSAAVTFLYLLAKGGN